MPLASPLPEWVGALTLAEALSPFLGLGLVIWLIRWLIVTAWPWIRRVTQFLDDWQGTPELPGHPREPGVPERLLTLETRLQRVEYQVQPNGGESAYDAMRLAVAELDAKVDAYHGSI